MHLAILLGPNEEYLGVRAFNTYEAFEAFVEFHEELIMANIDDVLPLKDRIELAPEYFPYAGRLWGIEYEEIK